MKPVRPIPGILIALLAACGSPATELDAGPKLPPEAKCAETLRPGADAAELSSALEKARSGDCVLAAPGKYQGSFLVPEGVTLLAETGTEVIVVGDQEKAAALELRPGASVIGLEVASAAWIGIRVEDGPATLSEVRVSEAAEAALYATCMSEACTGEKNAVQLRDVSLRRSKLGLWAKGTRVVVDGGEVSEHGGTGLTAGFAVVATHGAVLQMNGATVEKNQGEIGVFVDGEGGTELKLSEVTVADNAGRGVWVQKIAGSEASPKVQLEKCSLLGNRLVGLGALSARGIIIIDGRVADTIAATAMTQTGQMTEVGDGIGLFEGTGETRIERVELSGNQRAQALVDAGERGIIIIDGKVERGVGKHGVVVQNTTVEVVAQNVESPELLDGAAALPVSAPEVAAPSL